MKPAAFDYRCAADLEEACRLLAEGEGRAKIMAGGQSFGPMLNLRLTRPRTVVDITRVPALDRVELRGGDVVIGASVTHAAIEDGLHAQLAAHPMRSVAAGIAYRAVRNRGTVGGSLAHADPAADWIVTLTAMGARLSLRSSGGALREITMGDFMQAAYTTVLATDEVITEIHVPQAHGARWGYYKFCRKPGEFAEASAAVWQPAGGTPRIVLGALDGAPLLLAELAGLIDDGTAPDKHAVARAVHAALPDRAAVDNQLHAVCVTRALAQAGYVAARSSMEVTE